MIPEPMTGAAIESKVEQLETVSYVGKVFNDIKVRCHQSWWIRCCRGSVCLCYSQLRDFVTFTFWL